MTREETLTKLAEIERQSNDAMKPTGSFTTSYSGFDAGTSVETYRGVKQPPGESGMNPNGWANIDEQLENVYGDAFAVVQRYFESLGKKDPAKRNSKTEDNIWHIANYVKHRGAWDAATWAGTHAPTLTAITALGEAPPATPGQLARLCKKALGLQISDRFSLAKLKQIAENAV